MTADSQLRDQSADATDWQRLEQTLRCDLAGRGLAGYRHLGQPLGAGHFRSAAYHLARHATSVGIVTGFAVVTGGGVAGETDGPPGALYLARALLSLGIHVTLISDDVSLPLLEAGCDHWRLGRDKLCRFPFDDHADHDGGVPVRPTGHEDSLSGGDKAVSEAWVDEFFRSGPGARLSHLIAVERVGPSHTLDSLSAQPRSGAVPRRQFEADAPRDTWDTCHNMRGEAIHRHTANTHRLFEVIEQRNLPVTTIGAGDGGNEIGMGSFAWEMLREAITTGPGGRIACRVATDYTLVAGVSNWAAYALAAAVAHLRRRRDAVGWGDAATQRQLIELLVREAGAVDGRTARRQPTVDGLPLDAYLKVLSDLHAYPFTGWT